jgi:hypothetical protein
VNFKNRQWLERFSGGRLAPTWQWPAVYSLAWSAGTVLYHVVSETTLEFILILLASGAVDGKEKPGLGSEGTRF